MVSWVRWMGVWVDWKGLMVGVWMGRRVMLMVMGL